MTTPEEPNEVVDDEMAALTAPERSGSREQARELLAPFPTDLSGSTLEINCEGVFVATPSFMDEIVKIILVERHASACRLVRAPDRTAEYARRAAANRSVQDRLIVDPV